VVRGKGGEKEVDEGKNRQGYKEPSICSHKSIEMMEATKLLKEKYLFVRIKSLG
jgi:hypothetical protein